MTRFDFDEPIDRRGTASVKWDRYADPEILPLWVADMDRAVAFYRDVIGLEVMRCSSSRVCHSPSAPRASSVGAW